MSAATELHDQGYDVRVLEARERVGGRVWSTTLTNGAIVELGAEWIMADDHAVQETAARFELDLVETGASYGRREPWGPGAASLDDQLRFLDAARAAREAAVSAALITNCYKMADRIVPRMRGRSAWVVRHADHCVRSGGSL